MKATLPLLLLFSLCFGESAAGADARSEAGKATRVSLREAPGAATILGEIQEESYDTILYGGRIVDGTGNQWFYGDVAISGHRIARIARPGVLDQANARQRIDVHGLVVAPGFVDIQ